MSCWTVRNLTCELRCFGVLTNMVVFSQDEKPRACDLVPQLPWRLSVSNYPSFQGEKNNEQHLSEPCHPIVFCPSLCRDLAMPSCWAHFARGPDMFVCFAQRMTRSWGYEKVVAAPDLTSHPSFCLMPVPQSCDDWKTHIFSQVSK